MGILKRLPALVDAQDALKRDLSVDKRPGRTCLEYDLRR